MTTELVAPEAIHAAQRQRAASAVSVTSRPLLTERCGAVHQATTRGRSRTVDRRERDQSGSLRRAGEGGVGHLGTCRTNPRGSTMHARPRELWHSAQNKKRVPASAHRLLASKEVPQRSQVFVRGNT